MRLFLVFGLLSFGSSAFAYDVKCHGEIKDSGFSDTIPEQILPFDDEIINANAGGLGQSGRLLADNSHVDENLRLLSKYLVSVYVTKRNRDQAKPQIEIYVNEVFDGSSDRASGFDSVNYYHSSGLAVKNVTCTHVEEQKKP